MGPGTAASAGLRALRPLRALLVAGCALMAASGGGPPARADGRGSAETDEAGFEAVVEGAYEGEVSGPGVLEFLPGAGFDKQGYFFLADGQGIRPFGVTFVLPPGTGPGRHALESPSPFDLGTVPSVRVDVDMGDSVISADANTSGSLELTAFPADASRLRGSDVRGRFAFETEGRQGERLTVQGRFAFTAE